MAESVRLESNLQEKLDYSEMYPYDLYSNMRKHGDLVRMGESWLAVGYDAVQQIFVDRRFEAVHPSETIPNMILGDMNWLVQAVLKPPLKFIINRQTQMKMTRDWIIFQNPPDHTRIRRLAQEAFTPKAIEAMRPKIAKITNDLLDLLESKSSFDLVEEFAYPLPIAMIAEVLGLSEDNSREFKGWSKDIIRGFSFDSSDSEVRERAKTAIEGTVNIFKEEIDYRQDHRGDDVISNLLNAKQEDEAISEDEMISNLILLLIAGHETTVNLITNTIYALLTNPEQFEMLKNDHSLLDNTIEESLRFDPPLTVTSRKAAEDIDLQGYHIEAGSMIQVCIYGANRDPSKFENPDSFEITRSNSRRHLAFGKGIHYCLGAPLARAEADIAFSEIIKRFPDMRLDPENHPKRKDSYPFSTFESFKILK